MTNSTERGIYDECSKCGVYRYVGASGLCNWCPSPADDLTTEDLARGAWSEVIPANTLLGVQTSIESTLNLSLDVLRMADLNDRARLAGKVTK